MDFSILVILWIIFIVIEKFAKKNPPKKSDNKNFEIPTLPNDPNFHSENLQIFQDEVKPAEFREKFPQQPKSDFQSEKNFRRDDFKENNPKLPLNLNPDSAVNAIILSEIFSKPKSLRK